jgi:fructokinase
VTLSPGDARPLITCLGELLVDFLPIDEDGRTVAFRMHPGGSLLNVAVASARLGARVALAGKVGSDLFGAFLREYVQGEEVEVRWLREVEASTTLAFVATEHGEPRFAFYGQGAADTLVTLDELPDALFDQTAILHVGSISLLRGTTPAAVLEACRRLRGRALLSLDPNVRPNLVTDERAYRDVLDRLFGLVDVVKISAADLAWLAPGGGIEEAAPSLLARGPALVVVTRGADGVVAFRDSAAGRSVHRAAPFPVAVVDTVGAGDAFNGGLLVRLAELGATTRDRLEELADADLDGVLRFATAAAAINCTRAGADPPRRAALESLLCDSSAEGDSDDGH